MASIECGNKDGRCYEEKKELIFLSYSNTSSTNTSFYIPTTATDLKNWILRNPYIKGDLVDLRT